jgi:hypothetical protein
MYGYIAMYKGKQIEVYAATKYLAQCEAAKVFKVPAKLQYKVDVYLCERPDGSPVLQVITS